MPANSALLAHGGADDGGRIIGTVNFFDFVKEPGNTALDEIVLDPAQVARLQGVILEIARDVKSFCERHDIEFTLAAGSALGAVRHGGIIPWDDDIDLNMTRTAWESFYPGFAAEFADRYVVLSPQTLPGTWPLQQIKICRRDTTLREVLTAPQDATGAFVDIFLIESTSDLRPLRLIQGLGSQALRLICSCVRLRSRRRYLEEVLAGNPVALKWFRRRIRLGALFAFLTPPRWVGIADRWHGAWRSTRSAYVTSPSNVGHYFGEMLPRDVMYPPARCEFEGEDWPVPAQVERYLENRYGDWRRLPDVARRTGHVFAEFDLGEDISRSGGTAS